MLHYLVKSRLRDGVVLEEGVLLLHLGLLHLPEHQRQLRVLQWQLELQLIVVLLLELCQRERLGHQLLEPLDGVGLSGGPEGQRVAGAESVLEVLRGAETLESAVDHDTETRAEGLALLHGVGGEDDGLAAAEHLQDAVPEEAAGAGVHAGRGLVLKRIYFVVNAKEF